MISIIDIFINYYEDIVNKFFILSNHIAESFINANQLIERIFLDTSTLNIR